MLLHQTYVFHGETSNLLPSKVRLVRLDSISLQEPFEEGKWRDKLTVKVKCAEHFLFHVFQVLLLKLDLVLFSNKVNHYIEGWRYMLLQFCRDQNASRCKCYQTRDRLFLDCYLSQVSVSET